MPIRYDNTRDFHAVYDETYFWWVAVFGVHKKMGFMFGIDERN